MSRKLTTEGEDLVGALGEAHFSELYHRNMRELLGYALRRCADPDDAADVVAETFLTAWRRLADVPLGADGRLWLFGTARHVLANHDRSARRRDRLTERLRDELRCQVPAHRTPEAGPFLDAMADLPEPDRELLMLIGWEELTPSEAARALRITPAAARVRLHRARRRLRARLGERRTPDPHETETRVEEAR
jgi:RNA polymerase sigma-70 factor (ECF subfamily)